MKWDISHSKYIQAHCSNIWPSHFKACFKLRELQVQFYFCKAGIDMSEIYIHDGDGRFKEIIRTSLVPIAVTYGEPEKICYVLEMHLFIYRYMSWRN